MSDISPAHVETIAAMLDDDGKPNIAAMLRALCSTATASEKALADEVATGIAVREALKLKIHSLERRLSRSDEHNSDDSFIRNGAL